MLKALTLYRPYLAGVVLGDGWVTPCALGLHVADRDFAETVAVAVRSAFDRPVHARRDGRYWRVMASNKTGRFNSLIGFEPKTKAEKAAWLRGFFDSEGCAHLGRSRMSSGSWNRHVSMYSTERRTLERAAGFLGDLGISSRPFHSHALGSGHKGTRPVLALALRCGPENFARFAVRVGSSIARKQRVLDAIPASYLNRSDYCSRGGQRGSATRWAGRTQCVHGHALTPDNVKLTKKGARRCLACARQQVRDSRDRRK